MRNSILVSLCLSLLVVAVVSLAIRQADPPASVQVSAVATSRPQPVLVAGVWLEAPEITVVPSPTPTVTPPEPAQPTLAPVPPPPPEPQVQAAEAPVYESYFYSDEELKGMMRQAGFFEDSLDWWVRVVKCESHGDPNALGGYDPWIVQYEVDRRVPAPGLYIGLLQVDAYYHQAKAEAEYGPGANLMNPVVNLRVGLIISGGGYPTNAWPYCSKV